MKMFKENNFKILLICLAIGQICLAQPTNNEAKEQTNTPSTTHLCECTNTWQALLCENDDQKTSSLQLLEFVLSGLLDISENVTKKIKNITDQILSDQDLLQIANNDEVKTFMRKLQNSKEECVHCRCSTQMNRLLDTFLTECASYYEQEERNRWSPDGKAILNVIKKYGIEKMLNDYDTDVNMFIEKFEEMYANLKEAIGKENNAMYRKIRGWYVNFNTVKNTKAHGRKVRAFRDLVDRYKKEFIEKNSSLLY